MKSLTVFLLLSTNLGFSQPKTDTRIDTRHIKMEGLLWDLISLNKAPEVEWINRKGSVHTLLYRSVDYEGRATQVFAYYSNPEIGRNKLAGKRKFPGIVLVHGGGGKAFREWVEKWTANGYAAIAMDLSGNDEAGNKLAMAGADQADSNKFKKLEKGKLQDVWTFHAVASVILAHSFLLKLPEVDDRKTCITGISWGGYLTCIAASLDRRFKAAAPVYGCGYYDESDVFKESLRFLSKENKQMWMKYFDPSSYLPFVRVPFLFVNGNKDFVYNVLPYHRSYSLVKKSLRTVCIRPDMEHSHEIGWESKEILCFFENIINGGTPLIKVTSVRWDDAKLKLIYRSSKNPLYADFYYTSDTLSLNAKRDWSVLPAVIDHNKQMIHVSKPKEGFKYAFFYIKDERGLSVSSEFIISSGSYKAPYQQKFKISDKFK